MPHSKLHPTSTPNSTMCSCYVTSKEVMASSSQVDGIFLQ